MYMDEFDPISMGMGVDTVTKECGGAQSRSRSRPVATLRRGSGEGGLVFRRVVSGVTFRCDWSLRCAGPASMVQGVLSQPFIWSLSAKSQELLHIYI